MPRNDDGTLTCPFCTWTGKDSELSSIIGPCCPRCNAPKEALEEERPKDDD